VLRKRCAARCGSKRAHHRDAQREQRVEIGLADRLEFERERHGATV
jgi:hypothetical protein